MKVKELAPIVFVLLLIGSCGKLTKKEKEEQVLKNYRQGLILYKKGNYDKAVESLRKAEEGIAYLTPDQIRKLKYKLALALYKAGKYESAIIELEDYITFYPTAPNIEEAYYYLIKAYLKVSPDPWRDQTYTQKALKLINEFFINFPNSKYLPLIEELKEEALKKLAQHQLLIAKFYEDYGYYYPAALRYEYVLLAYPNEINKQEVLFHYIKNLLLIPQYAKKKEKVFLQKYQELKKKIDKGEIKDKKAAQKRLEFFLDQIKRWKRIAKEAFQKGEKNLQLYKQKYGEDKYYKILLKIKNGKGLTKSWIEKVL